MANRISQSSARVISGGLGAQRISQFSVTVISRSTTHQRLSQISARVLSGGIGAQRLSQISVTVISSIVDAPIPPGNEFTIAGTPRDILQNWFISEQLNERGTMRFGIKSMDASYRPGLREVVDFNWVGIHFFAGHIHHTEEAGLGGYGVVPIVTQCGATDFNALPDRRKRAITLPAGTLKSQLLEVAELLEIYGTTVDPAQVNGPMMPEMVFTLGTITEVLDKLSLASGYAWNISYDNVISMFAPGSVNAPFDIEDNDARVVGDVRVSPTTVNYGNHITVKYTEPATVAYVYLVMDAIPLDGDWIKVGGTTFTFKDTPVGPDDIQIAANVPDTLDNVVTHVDAEEEVTAAIQAADSVKISAFEAGASGNSINVESLGDTIHFGVEGVPIASHLYNGTDAALTGSVVAEDVPAQDGGANLFELVFEEPTVESEETAQAIADGYLVRSLVQPREIRYRTRLHGLHPGQQQRIQVTGRNIGVGSPPGSPCLITAVEISPEGSALYNYDVTAVEGLVIVESHQEKWRRMGGRAA